MRMASRLPFCWQKLSCELAKLKVDSYYTPPKNPDSEWGWKDGWADRRHVEGGLVKSCFWAKDRGDNELSTETDERGVFYSSESLSDGPKTGISGSVRQVVFVILLLSEKRSNNSYRRYYFSFIFTSSVNDKVKNQSQNILNNLIIHALEI